MEVKGVDLGGVFNFIRHRPPDSEHTKEKKLWINRFRSGLCPHCGCKLFRVRRFMLQERFVPLNIPGKVDNGVCVHPRCDPPVKKAGMRPKNDNEIDDDDSVMTVQTQTDSLLDAIHEHRSDMAKFYGEMKKRSKEDRETAALMLEDSIMQINRSIAELSDLQKAELGRVEGELRGEIHTANTALRTLQGRVGHIEEVTSSLKRQFVILRQEVQRERQDLQARLQHFQQSLGEGRNDQREEILALTRRLNEWQRENNSLRDLNATLETRLESSLREVATLQAQLARIPFHKSPPAMPASRSQFSSPDPMGDFPQRRRFFCTQTLTDPTDPVTSCTLVAGRGLWVAFTSNCTLFICPLARTEDGKFCQDRRQPPQKHTRHSNPINCMAAAEDLPKTLVTGSDDKTLVVWRQTASGQYKDTEVLKEHTNSVYGCSITKDGATLVSGCKDGSIIIWQRSSINGSFQLHQSLGRTSVASVDCCAISNNGSFIVAGSADETLSVWECQRNGMYKENQALNQHTDGVLCCTIDDSGHNIVSGSKDNKLVVWTRKDTSENFKYKETLEKHTEWVNCCVLCNNGLMLVSGSDDSTLRVWTRDHPDATFESKQTLKKHGNFVQCCASSCSLENSPTLVVSGANDNALKIWQLQP